MVLESTGNQGVNMAYVTADLWEFTGNEAMLSWYHLAVNKADELLAHLQC